MTVLMDLLEDVGEDGALLVFPHRLVEALLQRLHRLVVWGERHQGAEVTARRHHG